MKLNSKILITAGCALAGMLLAAGVIALVMKSGARYTRDLQDAELKNSIAVGDALARTQAIIEGGNDVSPCFPIMERLAGKNMLPEQKLKYNELWGDLYVIRYRENTQEKVRQIFYNRAVKQYNIAAQLALTPETRGSLYRRNAALHMEAGEWNEALELLKSAYPLITNPGERWQVDLDLARCYQKSKQPIPGLLELNKALESDNDDVWAAAALLKAGLFMEALDDPVVRNQLVAAGQSRDKNIVAAVKNRQLGAYFENKVADLYRDVSQRMPRVSHFYTEAQLGLLQLAVKKRDAPEAYRLANRIMSSPAGRMERVKALLALVDLEENRGRYQDSIALIQRALEKYPAESSRFNVGMRLYNLYKKAKNWDAAFTVARNLFQESSDPEAICHLVEDFSSGRNRIFELLVNSPDKEYYIKQLREIFASMAGSHPTEWNRIRVNANFVLGQLYFACDNYPKTDEYVNQCFRDCDTPDHIDEKILALDLRCALKSHAPPPVIVCRAIRYLNHFPRGEYYREALLNLLRVYCDTGFYQPALLIARKIYADELDSFSDHSKKADTLWMETIAAISSCYYHLGEFDKAAKLLRNFSHQLLDKQYGPKIYYTWATMAMEKQQDAEALRRLDVALMYNSEIPVRLKLQVAQTLLLIQSGSLKDFYGAATLLRRILRETELTAAQKEVYYRELTEAMLGYAIKNGMTKEFDQMLNTVVRREAAQQWCQYWVLRALTPAFQSDSLETLNRKHEEMLQSDYLKIINDQWTHEFIREQLVLIRTLIDIEARMEKIRNKG